MLDVLRHHGKFNFPLANPILFYCRCCTIANVICNCITVESNYEVADVASKIQFHFWLLFFFPLQKIISIIQINFEQKRRNYPRNNYNIIVTNKIEYNRFPLFSPQNGTRVFIRGIRQKIQEQTNPAKHSSGECNEALVRFQLVDIDSRNLVEEQTCPFHSFV